MGRTTLVGTGDLCRSDSGPVRRYRRGRCTLTSSCRGISVPCDGRRHCHPSQVATGETLARSRSRDLRGGRELFVTRDNHKDHSGVPRAAAGFSPAIHAGSICWDILGPAHQLQWLGRYCGRETPWSIPILAHDAPRCARCKVEFISCRRASARQVPGSDCRPKFARRLPRGGCAAALRLLVKMRQGLAWVAAGRCRGRLPQYCASYCGSTDTVIHCVHCGIGTAVPVVVLWELFGHV